LTTRLVINSNELILRGWVKVVYYYCCLLYTYWSTLTTVTTLSPANNFAATAANYSLIKNQL